MDASQYVILGANGQIGHALRQQFPAAIALDSTQLNITSKTDLQNFDWSSTTTILNAAAYTDVDAAEAPDGKANAWRVNAGAVKNIATLATAHDMTLIHISSDYVFDGTVLSHSEHEVFSPLGVYGQTKVAGDVAASQTPKHYVLRASWVIGSGDNFVRSMLQLGQRGISPSVVADQFGRLTFSSEVARVIDHLLHTSAAFGTYNITNAGDIVSWAEIARQTYDIAGYTAAGLRVSDTTAAKYFAGKISAPRPVHSQLELTKIMATGFKPHDWRVDLEEYITQFMKEQAV